MKSLKSSSEHKSFFFTSVVALLPLTVYQQMIYTCTHVHVQCMYNPVMNIFEFLAFNISLSLSITKTPYHCMLMGIGARTEFIIQHLMNIHRQSVVYDYRDTTWRVIDLHAWSSHPRKQRAGHPSYSKPSPSFAALFCCIDFVSTSI